jgi:transposase
MTKTAEGERTQQIGRPPREALRTLSNEERDLLEQIGRSGSERADVVARAKCLVGVANGMSFTGAARAAGRRSADVVARLVRRFNAEGVRAVRPRWSRGPTPKYGPAEKERILHEFRRAPDPEKDGTATWSLTTLKRALRTAPDGLPEVCTQTILRTLHEAGYTWQADRTWCKTGVVQRRRKGGVVEVLDPRATEKRG